MKIAFFSNSYLPYLSGITISIRTLKEGLEALGHKTFVVCPKYPNHPSTHGPIYRLPSIPAPYPGYRFVWPYSYKIFKQLKQDKINLIHAHQPFGVGLAALLLARNMKIPFVYTFHTLFSRYVFNLPLVPKTLTRWLLVKYLTWFCNRADTIIVPSDMVRRLLVARKVQTPIKVIPTGVKIEKAVSRKPSAVSRKTLLCTGRLSKEKNINFLLEAFPDIEKQEPNIQLIIVGSGPIENELRRQAEQVSPKISVTGQVSREKLIEYYHDADLFVYSSRTETQGLVLTEAKAAGLAIVALFGGGVSDVVQSGLDGYLVPPRREKFVEHVVRLLRDDQMRQEMGEKALLDAHERFSTASVAKKFETLYNSLTVKE